MVLASNFSLDCTQVGAKDGNTRHFQLEEQVPPPLLFSCFLFFCLFFLKLNFEVVLLLARVHDERQCYSRLAKEFFFLFFATFL